MSVDRDRIGLVAMEAMDEIDTGPDSALQGVIVVVAVTTGEEGQSTVNYRFKDGDGKDLDLSVGLQMLGLMLQGMGRGGPAA